MLRTWNWNPFSDIEALRREIDRVFEEVGVGAPWPGPFSRVSFLPGRAARAYPLLNLREDSDAFYLECLAPGIDPKSLNVSVVENQVTISGEKPAPPGGSVKPEAYHRNERAAGRFVRSIELPADVDSAKAKADYKYGILDIRLPKAESAKPKRLSIDVK